MKKHQPKIFFQKLRFTFLFILFFALFLSEAQAQKTLEEICPNLDQQPCAIAKDMIISAQFLVLGDQPKGNDWTYSAKAMLNSPIVGEEKFIEGLSLKDAIEYFKVYAASPFSGEGTRMMIVQRVFYKIYGTTPTVQENNFYKDQISQKKAWYSSIFFAERNKLNSSSENRGKMINHMYFMSMGRDPRPEEKSKWLKSSDTFHDLFVQTRKYLYSPAGVADLKDLVKRALTKINKKEPSDAEIQTAIAKYKPGKKIYQEILLGKDLGYGF